MQLPELRGPFDIVGDVHGCLPELRELLARLGYALSGDTLTPPPGRTLVFLGDLVDRGPDTPGVLELVMNAVERGQALCLLGNHDEKLRKFLSGQRVTISGGLEVTLGQLRPYPPAFERRLAAFLEARPHHHVLDEGRLVVAHAGLSRDLHGRDTKRARAFALYGDTTGERDGYGLPMRRDWAARYGGEALVVYGHTPVREARWLQGTVNIDTGCVFGGQLSALRYPEREVVSVEAARVYSVPQKPLPGA